MANYELIRFKRHLGLKESSRDLQLNYIISFLFILIFYACVQRFDETYKKFFFWRTKALCRWTKFLDFDAVAFSFLFDKNYLIME